MRNLLSRLAGFVSWHRRSIGALLAASAVLLLAPGLRPEGPTRRVVVTVTSLTAGHRLEPADLTLHELPLDALPSDPLTSLDDAVGRTLTARSGGGTILQPGSLTTDHAAGPGRAVVPVSIADASLRSLLDPGDLLSLVAQGPDGMEVLSGDARVVTLPARRRNRPGWRWRPPATRA
nr:SAF domain-containing protein [Tessaracoccus coleopterorum]